MPPPYSFLFILSTPQFPIPGFAVQPMESLQQLSNESFSYSWLINIKPASFDTLDDDGLGCSFDAQDGGAFIEMDPDFISMRWTSEGHDFDFGLPSSQAPVLVHADQIFSNGVILPLHLISTPPKSEAASDCPYSALSRSPPVDSSKTLLIQSNRYCPCYFYALPSGQISSDCSPVFQSAPSTPTSKSSCPLKRSPSRILKLKLPFLANCVRSPKRMLRKYWSSLLTPLCKKINELRLTSMKAVRSGGDNPVGAPGASNSFSRIEWCYSNATADMGDERKIYDAVLHCKKSIDK